MTYDVIVIGGGPAGLSGAVALSRALRSVLVIDAGEPRNAPADGIHNFLTRDDIAPADFRAAGQTEVRHYGGEIIKGRVTGAGRDGDLLTVRLADGRSYAARRLLVTTGLTDELPDLPGLREHWGHAVVHCPYCHGFEVRGRSIGILGSSPMSLHQALMWRQWSDDITLFLHTAPEPDAEQARQFAARGITVVTEKVAEVLAEDGKLTGVRLTNGTVVARDTLVVAPRFVANAEPLPSLGLTATDNDFGSAVAAEPTGRTAVPGVWVAGNVSDQMAQVISAAAAGLNVAAQINSDLIMEDTTRAVAALG
ncbi:thioredoxin reductase [Actinoplanes sp. ATCC 53533]|uniref:NAD(P)/FAD-dependent oxidoreductase n=1 Tax=Actinoplanes sp. ATCC 53533 TaxID=1288362 RepID=UPI000F7A79DA|nr:NAD(P)/FAD-dependent oxidoreductase [Actinoplanes sp. ATCC 53533]RSM60241.1 thioredoxin reductase [Actinoplanes sp. ATCC 53533]